MTQSLFTCAEREAKSSSKAFAWSCTSVIGVFFSPMMYLSKEIDDAPKVAAPAVATEALPQYRWKYPNRSVEMLVKASPYDANREVDGFIFCSPVTGPNVTMRAEGRSSGNRSVNSDTLPLLQVCSGSAHRPCIAMILSCQLRSNLGDMHALLHHWLLILRHISFIELKVGALHETLLVSEPVLCRQERLVKTYLQVWSKPTGTQRHLCAQTSRVS